MDPIKNGELYSKFITTLIEVGKVFTLSRGGSYASGGDSQLEFVPLFGDECEAMSFATGGWEGMSVKEIGLSEIEILFGELAQSGLRLGFFLNDTQPPLIFDAKLLCDELSRSQNGMRK